MAWQYRGWEKRIGFHPWYRYAIRGEYSLLSIDDLLTSGHPRRTLVESALHGRKARRRPILTPKSPAANTRPLKSKPLWC